MRPIIRNDCWVAWATTQGPIELRRGTTPRSRAGDDLGAQGSPCLLERVSIFAPKCFHLACEEIKVGV